MCEIDQKDDMQRQGDQWGRYCNSPNLEGEWTDEIAISDEEWRACEKN